MAQTRVLLLIEDVALKEILTARLRQEGFDVTSQGDQSKGLAFAKTSVPALIVFGLAPPAKHAAKFCRAVRRDRITHEIPILVFADVHDDPTWQGQFPENVVLIRRSPL